VTLHHAAIDEGQRLLRTWDLENIPGREEFHALVEEIDGEASEDSQHLGWGVQRYVVRAMTAQGRELGSLSLRYSSNAPATDGSGGFVDSEPASSRGQVALAMRHTDAAFRLLGLGYTMIVDSMNRRSGQQDQLIERMLQTHVRLIEMQQELAAKGFEREAAAEIKKREAELDFMREVEKMDRNQMLLKLGVEKVGPLLPLVANRLLGDKAAPSGATPRHELVAQFMASLTPEQIEGLQRVFTPMQVATLEELFLAAQNARGSTPAGGGTGRLSQEAAYKALDEIRKTVLPWGVARLKAGQPLDPTSDLPQPTRIFQLLLRAMTRAQYDDLVARDEPFSADERRAFIGIAEALGVVPQPEKPNP
jgi:hypothetical protein